MNNFFYFLYFHFLNFFFFWDFLKMATLYIIICYCAEVRKPMSTKVLHITLLAKKIQICISSVSLSFFPSVKIVTILLLALRRSDIWLFHLVLLQALFCSMKVIVSDVLILLLSLLLLFKSDDAKEANTFNFCFNLKRKRMKMHVYTSLGWFSCNIPKEQK